MVSTDAFDHLTSTSVTASAPQDQTVRIATFVGEHARVLGEIVVYRGNDSWVFMNINGSAYDGPVICKLKVRSGSTVMAGTFELDGGSGQWERTISVNIN